MAITTYAELQTAVGNRMNRTDLVDRIPEFIALAEAEFNRVLRLNLNYAADATLAASSRYTALPADLLQLDRVLWLDGATRRPLEFVAADATPWRDDGTDTASRPRYYAIRGLQLELLPAPTAAVSLRLSYWQRIPALATTVNALFAQHPDVYLYRALLEAAMYMQDEKRTTYYQGLYDRLMTELKAIEARQRRATDVMLRTDLPTGAGGFDIVTG